ncbi:hypothetical protein NVP1135O_21 [Vibrio phage 1.135.O._10N.222.54.B6]|nr:hypothetical protein NVP1135O_21 [Vibrio phage 1.135.O._10N.222.54.B6]
MKSRNKLTFTEFVEHRSIAGVNHNNYEGVNRKERKLIWKSYADKHFPLLDDCPICKSSASDGYVKFSAFYMLGLSNGGGGSDAISCSYCDLEFKGNYYNGSVISQWNDR